MRPRLVLGFLVLGMFLSLGCANKMFGMSRDRWLSMTPGEQSAAIDSYNTRQREQAAAEAAVEEVEAAVEEAEEAVEEAAEAA